MVWKLGVPLIVAVAALGALLPAPARAQDPGAQAVAVCPVFEAPNGVEVCVDRGEGSTYFEGDPIRICVTVNIPQIAIFPPPPPPLVRVTDRVDGYPPRVIFEEYFASGQRCLDAVIAPPLGRETIRADVIDRNGRVFASDSTFFFSRPRHQPPPQQGSISVDRGPGGVYRIGDSIRICYDIPAPGQVTITDIQPNGSHILLNAYDDGTGDCFYGVVTPPPGRECLRLDFWTYAGNGTAQVCFQVVGNHPPPANAFIATDRSEYKVGDPIRICYDVPSPGPISITSYFQGGSRVIFSGYEDGTGGCINTTLGYEVGIKCLRLNYTSGGSGQRQTCFRVRW